MGADAAWEQSAGIVRPNATPQRAKVENCCIETAAKAFNNNGKVMLLVEHHATTPEALIMASKIAAHTGCRIVTGTFPARVEGGPDAPAIERLPYFPEQVLAMLSEVDQLILVGAQVPASFFAYQGTPGRLVSKNCTVSRLCTVEEDAIDALSQLATQLGACDASPILFEKKEIPKPTGSLNTKTVIQAVAATMPEHLIVATDSGGGNAAYAYCQNSAPVSWLALTGGAIGQGSPVATGAAIACPDRPVLALLGDGGAAYTIQSLWTQARENLNVVTLIFANNSYNILNVEYSRLGVTEVGEVAASLFDMSNPTIDWVSIAKGFGIEGAYADTSEDLCNLLETAYKADGPFLIQANIKDR
jgi:acetolactate synthase-1/2/3 large subunit